MLFISMELPIYKLTIDEAHEGVSMVALVENPAIEENFMAFAKHHKFAETDKRVLTGPLMIPDKPIYRNDERGEYYVVFDKDTIYKIVQKLFKQGAQSAVNLAHATPVQGVTMFESYIIDREKGVMPPKGFDEPDGSWFGSFKVDNDQVWDEFIKTGKFKGFSVEGAFGMQPVNDEIEREF